MIVELLNIFKEDIRTENKGRCFRGEAAREKQNKVIVQIKSVFCFPSKPPHNRQ